MQDSFQGFDTFFTSGPNVIGMRQNFISYMFRVSTTQLNNDYMAALGFFFVCLLIEFANDMNVFDIFNHIFHCCLKPICCFTLNHGKRRVALSPVQLRQSQPTLHSVVNFVPLIFAIRTSSFVGGLCQNRDHLAHHLHVSAAQGTNQQRFVPLAAVPSL